MNVKNYTMSSSNYLLKNDLINKYNIKNVFKFPKVKTLKLKLYSEDLKKGYISTLSKTELEIMYSRVYLILYVLLSFFPKITVNTKRVLKKRGSNLDDDSLSFEVTIKNKKYINAFLYKLSVETAFRKKNIGNNPLSKLSTGQNSIFSLNTNIPLSQFYEVQEFFDLFYNDANLDHLPLRTNIIYTNMVHNIKVQNLLKHTSFFG